MDMGSLTDGIQADFSALATVAGVTSPDQFFRRAARSAYTLLGLNPDDPATVFTPQQALDAPWIAEYYALRSIVRMLAVKVDTETGVNKRKGSQAYTNAKSLLADAEAAMTSRGYAVEQLYSLTYLELDYIEPIQGTYPWY